MEKDFFGTRRLIQNRQNDLGYSDMAFATGDTAQINSVTAALTARNNELASINTALNTAKGVLATNQAALAANRKWQYQDNGLCKWTDSASKCAKKRSDWENSSITPIVNEINNVLQPRVTSLTSQKSDKEAEIKALTNQLASLLEAQKLEAQSTLTLAQQGQTPEGIKIEAQAQAQAVAELARVQAQTKERQSKSRKIIILSIILTAVVLAGLYVFYKIRKKA